jgi:hypothetical protein
MVWPAGLLAWHGMRHLATRLRQQKAKLSGLISVRGTALWSAGKLRLTTGLVETGSVARLLTEQSRMVHAQSLLIVSMMACLNYD